MLNSVFARQRPSCRVDRYRQWRFIRSEPLPGLDPRAFEDVLGCAVWEVREQLLVGISRRAQHTVGRRRADFQLFGFQAGAAHAAIERARVQACQQELRPLRAFPGDEIFHRVEPLGGLLRIVVLHHR